LIIEKEKPKVTSWPSGCGLISWGPGTFRGFFFGGAAASSNSIARKNGKEVGAKAKAKAKGRIKHITQIVLISDYSVALPFDA